MSLFNNIRLPTEAAAPYLAQSSSYELQTPPQWTVSTTPLPPLQGVQLGFQWGAQPAAPQQPQAVVQRHQIPQSSIEFSAPNLNNALQTVTKKRTRHTNKAKVKNKLPGTDTITKTDKIWKCTNCKATDTPQKRIGALGKNSLCNACGIRWTKWCKLNPEKVETETAKIIEAARLKETRKIMALSHILNAS